MTPCLPRSLVALLVLVSGCTEPVEDAAQPARSGAHIWSMRLGDHWSDQGGAGVAVDAEGNVLLTGSFRGTVDFGGGPLGCMWEDDIFVAKLDPNGNHLWSKGFGDREPQYGVHLAVDGAANVVVTGTFRGTVDFGGGPLASAGGEDIFLAKFDSAGDLLWSRRFGDASDFQRGHSVVVDGSGNVLFTGTSEGTVDFGGGPLTGLGPAMYVAKLDSSGEHLWSRRFGENAGPSRYSIAVDSSDSVLLTGELRVTMDFGGGALASAGMADVFIAKLDSSGNHLWSRRFGDGEEQIARSIAVDGSGNAFLTGQLWGTVDFGGGPLASPLGYDLFVAKFDPDGNHVWSKRFGNDRWEDSRSMAVDAWGHVLVLGECGGVIDFGGAPLRCESDNGLFVATFDPSGNHVWSKHFGGAWGGGIAADSSGCMLLTGSFWDTVDFGGGPLTSAGGSDMFVAKLAP